MRETREVCSASSLGTALSLVCRQGIIRINFREETRIEGYPSRFGHLPRIITGSAFESADSPGEGIFVGRHRRQGVLPMYRKGTRPRGHFVGAFE
jgi:hypothetical protein